ncbi:MAG TPA: deoxyhypusine synthase family protein [Planctomycetota bacterium]|nr:deoxyhypusine synthase family protein [Planctomycetota bacterium]
MSPTRQDQRSCPGGPGRKSAGGAAAPLRELLTRPVTETEGLDQLFEQSLPSFGGGYLRRIWTLLDEAVGMGLPMTMAVAGPVTVSGQHFAWLSPLLDTGWFMLVSTTDAVCYHDGHRALDNAKSHPFHEVAIFGDDGALRDERTIRVTDVGFDEDVLLGQDQFIRAVLACKEFQRKMTGPEFRYLLGKRYAAQERQNGAREGLLALCTRKAIPIFVGAPGDGSVFLNSMALWALREACGDAYKFDLDIHGEVFESCAYHRWGLRESDTKALGTLILGGGVPKNFNLQPEPALSQVLGLEDIQGYLYDVQLTTAPITDGSLSSCPPAEAVTWGKVDKDHYKSTCESMQVDYSIVMPLITKALLDKRARFALWAERMGREELFLKHPEARGYLRDTAGYRLFDKREELVAKLMSEVRRRAPALRKESHYPLAPLTPDAAKPAARPKKSRRTDAKR